MATTRPTSTTLSTAELAAATGGGRDYIRTRNNVPVGLALRENFHPEGPDVLVFGPGPRVAARAKLLMEHGRCSRAVPVYVKRGADTWVYKGEYRATALLSDAATLQRYGPSRRGVGKVAGVLFLAPMVEPTVQVSGAGFADAQTRKEIEVAAVAHVTRVLKQRGFKVRDRQRENRGYDLIAESATSRLLVEVKGTDAPEPRFFLTRNELRCSALEADWCLFVVCSARQSPVLFEYSASDMRHQFQREPLAWECTPRDAQALHAKGPAAKLHGASE